MITNYCVIRGKTIFADGAIIFRDRESSVDDFLVNAYNALKIDYPKFYKMDNLSKLGFLAAEVLLGDNVLKSRYPSEAISVVLSNNNGSLEADKKYFESTKTIASPALFVYTLPNIVVGEICIRHKLKGENAFFVSDAFDAELMVTYVNMVLAQQARAGENEGGACLAGWVDVLNTHHDVFLYLTETNRPGSLTDTFEQVRSLYNLELWNN